MPIYRGKDSKGPFYQWGNQKKYISGNKLSRNKALEKVKKQMAAIYSSGYKNN